MIVPMAKQEVPKEDLMLQATALVRRIEFRTSADQPLVVVGFRRDGSASFYFGEHPVYQFNTGNELRRVHLASGMLKAENHRLVRLEKIRAASEVQLIRHVLEPDAQRSLIAELQRRLHEISCSATQQTCEVTRQVPKQDDILQSVQTWIAELGEIRIAATPNVAG